MNDNGCWPHHTTLALSACTLLCWMKLSDGSKPLPLFAGSFQRGKNVPRRFPRLTHISFLVMGSNDLMELLMAIRSKRHRNFSAFNPPQLRQISHVIGMGSFADSVYRCASSRPNITSLAIHLVPSFWSPSAILSRVAVSFFFRSSSFHV